MCWYCVKTASTCFALSGKTSSSCFRILWVLMTDRIPAVAETGSLEPPTCWSARPPRITLPWKVAAGLLLLLLLWLRMAAGVCERGNVEKRGVGVCIEAGLDCNCGHCCCFNSCWGRCGTDRYGTGGMEGCAPTDVLCPGRKTRGPGSRGLAPSNDEEAAGGWAMATVDKGLGAAELQVKARLDN